MFSVEKEILTEHIYIINVSTFLWIISDDDEIGMCLDWYKMSEKNGLQKWTLGK